MKAERSTTKIPSACDSVGNLSCRDERSEIDERPTDYDQACDRHLGGQIENA